MIKLLDMLFIKNINIDKDIFLNLYFSFDKISFVGINDGMFDVLKKYDSYEIIKQRDSEIGERHHEYKSIIKTLDYNYFVRIISDYRDLVYDILVYSITDYEKIERIFFPNMDLIPDYLIKLNKPIIKVDNHVNLIYNHLAFTILLGYEDWDYKNKCLNRLDVSSIDESFISKFNNNDLKGEFIFKTNGDSLKKFYIYFKYTDGFYIIDEILEK